MARQDSPPNYFVNQQSVTSYQPANHLGTSNYRLIGPETVGASHLGVVLGVIEPVRVLVIYSPPYGESPDKVIRG